MIISRIKTYCDRSQNGIFLYGAGAYGREMGIWLDEHDIRWNGFIETDSQTDHLLEKPVYSIDRILQELKHNKVGIIVCAGKIFRKEIQDVLQKNGIIDYLTIDTGDLEAIRGQIQYRHQYKDSSGVVVLLYHRVADLRTDPQMLAVGVSQFESQVKYLKDHFRILRFEDEWPEDGEKSIVITFDDGYADNAWNALPVLEKYDVPATIFVSTGNIDSAREMWWDSLERFFLLNENLPAYIEVGGETLSLEGYDHIWKSYLRCHTLIKAMEPDCRNIEMNRLEKELNCDISDREMYRSISVNELKRLSTSPVITIGGHTVTHNCLAVQKSDDQKKEIEQSKCRIEQIIEREISVFSYPFGGSTDFTEETMRIVKEVGYKKAGAVREGVCRSEFNNMDIPRVLVRNWDEKKLETELNRVWVTK